MISVFLLDQCLFHVSSKSSNAGNALKVHGTGCLLLENTFNLLADILLLSFKIELLSSSLSYPIPLCCRLSPVQRLFSLYSSNFLFRLNNSNLLNFFFTVIFSKLLNNLGSAQLTHIFLEVAELSAEAVGLLSRVKRVVSCVL